MSCQQTLSFRVVVDQLTFPLGHPNLTLSQLGLVEVNDEHAIEFRVPQRVWRPHVTVADTQLVDLAV